MNNDQRKLLTRMCGCIWHEHIPSPPGDDNLFVCSCGSQWDNLADLEKYCIDSNRTFTTWDDLGAVKEAIEKAGQFSLFYWWVASKKETVNMNEVDFVSWLINPERFCALAAEWAEKGGGRDDR